MSKFFKHLCGASFLAATLLSVGVPAAAGERNPSYGKRAIINWANYGGILDWHADNDHSIYLRDRTGRWYYATLSGRCPSLRFQRQVVFETGPQGEFDDWGVVRTSLYRCHVETLVTSPAPAAKGGPRLVR